MNNSMSFLKKRDFAEDVPSITADGLSPFYGITRCCLLARDPFAMFLYWEITPAVFDKASAEIAAQYRTVIRVNNVSANYHRDVDCDFSALNWYIHTERGGETYFCELGLLAQDGRFAVIARSNHITLPPDGVSDDTSETWIKVGENFEIIEDVSAPPFGAGQDALLSFLYKKGALSSSALVKPSSSSGMAGAGKTLWHIFIEGECKPSALVEFAGLSVRADKNGRFVISANVSDAEKETILNVAENKGARFNITAVKTRKAVK